jgi:outer membrane protein TolC
VATAESQLVDTQGQAQTSRLELGYLLVTPVEGALAVPEQLLSEAARSVESLGTVATGALERRPDILSARLRVQAQEAAALEPLARLLPSLSASGQYRVTAEPDAAGRLSTGSLSVDLTWNLFDGGERYAERRESLALARALTLQSEALTRRVDVAVERSEVSLRTAQAALASSQVAVQAARRNAEETGILYRQGLSTALAVADASVRLFEAEVALARARFALGAALLELRDAVGLDPLGKEP